MADHWRALWVLSAARVAMGFQFQSIGATAPMLREEYGLSLADVGWLVGMYLLPGVALALPGGLLSARFGDRRIAIAGTALMVAGGALSAFADGVATIQAGRLLGGIGGVIFNVTGTKMVADWFAGRPMELPMAIYVGTWPAGIGLGLLVLGPVAAAASPSAAFALTAGLAAVSLLLVVTLYRSAPNAAATGPIRWSALARGDGPRLALSAGAWTSYNVSFALLVAFLPTLFVTRGLPAALAGTVTATLTAAFVVSIPLFGWLIARYGRAMPFATLGVVGWSASVLAVQAGGDPVGWLTLAGLVAGSAAGVLVSAPAKFLSPTARSVGLGLFYTAFYAGMAVVPRLIGALADALGSPDATLIASAAFGVLTIALMLASDRATRRPARSDAPSR